MKRRGVSFFDECIFPKVYRFVCFCRSWWTYEHYLIPKDFTSIWHTGCWQVIPWLKIVWKRKVHRSNSTSCGKVQSLQVNLNLPVQCWTTTCLITGHSICMFNFRYCGPWTNMGCELRNARETIVLHVYLYGSPTCAWLRKNWTKDRGWGGCLGGYL